MTAYTIIEHYNNVRGGEEKNYGQFSQSSKAVALWVGAAMGENVPEDELPGTLQHTRFSASWNSLGLCKRSQGSRKGRTQMAGATDFCFSG